ncbi:MAG TPA: ATPase, T2SS/T4P/T4SS family [Candidatus Nitrosotenuis sp.]|nr:ATPase, T2SS/T4P/T4SS family [Candidatus Nitrosotenuis sp.]
MREGQQLESILARLSSVLEDLADTSQAPGGMAYHVDRLLEMAVHHRATMLHLNAGAPPTLRINQDLVPVGEAPLSREQCRALIRQMLTPEQRRSMVGGQSLDFCYPAAGTGFRVNVYIERGQMAATVRRLRTDIPKLENLGLASTLVERVLQEQQGLLLLTGNPRCGKINTLAALLSWLNHRRRVRIVLLEHPIQFWHQNLQATVVQREVGSDVDSFAHGVRQAILQDPDVLALSDLPDGETADACVRAAAGGHLVLALLDAPSCVRAVDRLLVTFEGGDGRRVKTLARALRAVVCQTLVARADGRGLLPAFEILDCTEEVRAELRGGQVTGLHHIMRQEGMQTLGRSLGALVRAGLVSRAEALRHVEDEEELELPEEPALAAPDFLSGPTSGAVAATTPEFGEEETPLMSWL